MTTDTQGAQSGSPPTGKAGGKEHANPTVKGGGKAVIGLDASIFNHVDVDVQAMLGQGHMTVADLLGLAEGSVVTLDTPLDGMVDVTLDGRVIARGEIVAVDDRFGVRIVEIVPAR